MPWFFDEKFLERLPQRGPYSSALRLRCSLPPGMQPAPSQLDGDLNSIIAPPLAKWGMVIAFPADDHMSCSCVREIFSFDVMNHDMKLHMRSVTFLG